MKHRKLWLLFIALCFSLSARALDHTNAFITVWDTQYMDTSNPNSLTIPIWAQTAPNNTYSYYWEKVGDATVNSGSDYQTKTGNGNFVTGITANSGVYRIYIKGNLARINMGTNANSAKALTKVESWGNINWINMHYMFSGCTNLTDIPTTAPDLSGVTNMSNMFNGAIAFNQAIGNWDVSNVTSMSSMFYGASTFNQDIGNWNVSNVTSMSSMFRDANAFNNQGNSSIGNWDVGKVTDMSYMFYDDDSYADDDVDDVMVFNQPIGNWNVSSVTTMSAMFDGAVAFNQDISDWDVSKVINMSYMFYGASTFNQDIGDWNVGNVTNMAYMFSNAVAFNQDIGEWVVSNVINMNYMFYNAMAFNQDISDWDVSKVTNMGKMFASAVAFNQNIGGWDVSKVTDMSYMFITAIAFDQDLGAWALNASVNMGNMLDYSGLSASNYGYTLKGWAENTTTPTARSLGAQNLKYTTAYKTYRDTLTGTDSWTITGDIQFDIIPTAGIVYVKETETGTGDGSSWTNATKYLDDATKTSGVQQVWIAIGQYQIDAGKSFNMKNGLTIYGGFDPDNGIDGLTDARWLPGNGVPNSTFLVGNVNSVVYNKDIDGTAVLDGVVLIGGLADQGGGMYNDNSSPMLRNLEIRKNNADNGAGILNINGSSPQFFNVTIVDNEATNSGGGIYNDASSPIFTNVTISNNKADNGGGIVNKSSASPEFYNSIVWGNTLTGGTSSNVVNDNSTPTFAYSLVQGSGTSSSWSTGFGTDGGHNIDADPKFTNTTLGYYTLETDSPAINAGNNSLYTGLDADTKDLLGNPRLSGAVIDLGAYEYQNSGTLSVDNDLKIGLRVYPNPVKETLYFSGEDKIDRIQILSLDGKTVSAKSLNGARNIDVHHLPQGVYLIQVFTEKGGQTFKIIKE